MGQTKSEASCRKPRCAALRLLLSRFPARPADELLSEGLNLACSRRVWPHRSHRVAVCRSAPARLSRSASFARRLSRTFVSILGGCCCGILGLTNWSGFAFFLFTSLLTSLVLIAKAGGADVKVSSTSSSAQRRTSAHAASRAEPSRIAQSGAADVHSTHALIARHAHRWNPFLLCFALLSPVAVVLPLSECADAGRPHRQSHVIRAILDVRRNKRMCSREWKCSSG